MDRLNYQHLLYVWAVAREGTVVRAARQLRLSQSTLSAQIHRFERVLGEPLFVRRGRRLELTESGRVAVRYASEIFSLGREFVATIEEQHIGKPVRLVVGVLDSLPKWVVRRMLEPVFRRPGEFRVTCREDGSLDGFLAELATFRVDLVIADAPAGRTLPVRVINHLVGESGTTFFARPAVAKKLRRHFPHSLRDAGFLMPGAASALHRALTQWFEAETCYPQVMGEIDDTELLRFLGESGDSVFAGPTVEEEEVCRRFRVSVVGRTDDVQQQFYAITAERRIKNPAVLAITESGRRGLFR